MWKFNPFTPKEPTSLEGRYFDVGNVKVYVRNPIAEGGFSCVYLARDALHASKQYALKHIICNDEESLELVMKEVSVMKLLRGHPNIIQLLAHTVIDMGRTKEAFLVMEFCDRSLVAVLEKRGPAFFEEKQILLIFRDVCNAVFVMHCQLPSVAHRDLKAENILLGPGGDWKLCDFGSTSTDHKCFERPEEMGIEEDNIRKHTTPAYRAPEMWDLYRKEFISEKVDIWALGCLLYRICYFKSAFDGESKLQILNGNYRIPEVPQYSTPITQLIKDMLQASPASRPDITQVWFRVNEQLPLELQKHLPDGPPSAANVQSRTAKLQDEGIAKRTNLMPQKTSYHHAASKEQVLQLQGNQMAGGVGSFWSTHQHGQGQRRDTSNLDIKSNTIKAPLKVPENNLIQTQQPKGNLENVNISKTGKGEEAEVNQLKEQLKKAKLEKSEITLKYQKLSEIWHSQKNEIQELKRALAAATTPLPQPKPESTNIHTSAVSIPVFKSLPAASTTLSQPKKESTNIQNPAVCIPAITLQAGKLEGGLWELEQGMFANCAVSPSPSIQPWQTFSEDPEPQSVVQNTTNPPVVSLNNNSWASFDPKPNIQDQPLGWAGF